MAVVPRFPIPIGVPMLPWEMVGALPLRIWAWAAGATTANRDRREIAGTMGVRMVGSSTRGRRVYLLIIVYGMTWLNLRFGKQHIPPPIVFSQIPLPMQEKRRIFPG
jgi:hypothetical protein